MTKFCIVIFLEGIMKILIIGNGIAGLSAAEEIRKKNKRGRHSNYFKGELSYIL